MGKVIGFGELLVRLSPPGFLKLIQADSLTVNYTGAEANVLVSLSRFGLDTDLVTILPDSDLSDAALSRLHKYCVGTDHVVLSGDRMGAYYLERGASQRPSKITYDRKYSAFSMAKVSDFDWKKIFNGASWFHFSGITAALGEETAEICEEACKIAREMGVTVSCDLNYRKNLWDTEKACSVMSRLAKNVDILIGNEEDAEKCLGLKPRGTNVIGGQLNYEGYSELAKEIHTQFGVEKVAFTLRTSISASDNKWAAMLWQNDKAYFSNEYMIHLVDRVGGGDSFSAGLIYAVQSGFDPQESIEFAVAASCLKQTIEQDFNLSNVNDVRVLMNGDGSGRVQR